MKNEVKFGLRKISTKQFATIASIEINEAKIDVNLGFGFGINQERNLLGCQAKFELRSELQPFIILDVICDFEIEEKTWNLFINRNEAKIIFPLDFIRHLAVITIGTTRGVLHSKTENTKYNKYFLPTINVTDILKKDVSIELV